MLALSNRRFIMFTSYPPFLQRLFFTLLPIATLAQVGTSDKPARPMADVNVIVTDFKSNARPGEQIIFIAKKNGEKFSRRAGKDGKFSLKLPTGDTFVIKVKTIVDSTKYGLIAIRELLPDEQFAEPFTVTVKFEPAKSYRLDNVYFDFGKYTLRPESFKELDELVSYMKWRENEKIEIGGHTDNVGTDADNLKLSQNRAESIKQYLIKKGINATRVTAKGYGASQPVTDNSTDEGRQKNRRTEVKIL
jgi:OmpA-OmpF porin, OOP family